MDGKALDKSAVLNLARCWFPLKSATSFKLDEKGYASTNWIFSFQGKRYMLKRFLDFKKRADILSEHRITNYIREAGFPYEVPVMLKNKSGKLFVMSGKRLYSMYGYIEGEADKRIDEHDAFQIGNLAAALHNITEKGFTRCKRRSGYGLPENIFFRLGKAYEIAKLGKNRYDKLFIKCYEWFLRKYENIDFSYYIALKPHPVHEDIAPDNILWRGNKVCALIDFANIGNYRDSFLMDIAWAVHFCCVGKEDGYGYNIGLVKAFFDGYKKLRGISKTEAGHLIDLIMVTNASDLEFAYSCLLGKMDENKYTTKMKQQLETSEWLARNRSRVVAAIFRQRDRIANRDGNISHSGNAL